MDVIIMQHFNSCFCCSIHQNINAGTRVSTLLFADNVVVECVFYVVEKQCTTPLVQRFLGLAGCCLRLAHNCIGNCVAPRLIESHLANMMAYVTSKCYLINYLLSMILGGQCVVFLFHQGTEQLHRGNLNTRDYIPITTKEVRYQIRLDPDGVVMLSFGLAGGGGEY